MEASAKLKKFKPWLGLLLLFALAAIPGLLFREQILPAGRWFMERFGSAGMGAGTFLADGVYFPIPPQAYLLAAIVSEGSDLIPFVAISIGSLAGGLLGICLGRSLSRSDGFRARVSLWLPSRDLILSRGGLWLAVIGGVSPVPFSTLCYLAGFIRAPKRVLAILLALRIPRLLVFYAIIRAGWQATA